MSLRAFAKGFSTAAAPSFIRSFEGQQDRIETRRREERAYTREDKIRAEDIEREDFNRSLEDAKASLLAGANTGDKAEVQKAYDALSEEVKGELSMVLPTVGHGGRTPFPEDEDARGTAKCCQRE